MDWLQTKIFGNLTKVFSESRLLLLTPASYEIAKNHLSIPQLEVLPKLFSSKEFLLLFFTITYYCQRELFLLLPSMALITFTFLNVNQY